MGILITGLILFVVLHIVPQTPLKPQLIEQLGRKPYFAAFGTVAIIAVGLVAWGYSVADYVQLYQPPAWGRHATMLLVLLSFISLASLRSNSHIRRFVRDPLGVAIFLWGLGHLFVRGDLASVLLFSVFALYGLGKLISEVMREPRPDFAVITKDDIRSVMTGLLIYAVIIFLHPYVIGVPVMF
ncbi:MAG: NnrU family protein [Hyphomicrobiales bacterium]